MKVVIVGDGKVGRSLSEMLSEEGHSVTVIEQDKQVLKRHTEEMDIIGVLGNGASSKAQIEAGVPGADLLIAATTSDEVNMLACLVARKLGCENTIARIRNPEYNEQLQLLREELGLSFVINPELSAAREIANVISFPNVDSLGDLAGGRVRIVKYTLEEDSPLAGQRLMDIRQQKGNNVVVCAVERNGEVHIPKGDFTLKVYDHIYVTGTLASIEKFLHRYGEHKFIIKNAIIVGGGKITYYLARMLEESRVHLKIIEKDYERCVELKETLPGVTVIEADGTEQAVLDEEGIKDVDALIALTDRDEENLIISLYATLQNVPKVITKINRTGYLGIVDEIGLDSIISPQYSAADQIARYVRAQQNTRGNKVDSLHKIVTGNAEANAEALEFIIQKDAKRLNEPLKYLPIAPNVLVAGIVRGQKLIFPTGEDHFQEQDRVIVVTTNTAFDDFNDIFE